jgi:hypothetical protein
MAGEQNFPNGAKIANVSENTDATKIAVFGDPDGNGLQLVGYIEKSSLGGSGSFSEVGTSTTNFTVTLPTTQPSNTYKVRVTPTNLLTAVLFYVANKTTTTFDVIFVTGLTGTVAFDWSIIP